MKHRAALLSPPLAVLLLTLGLPTLAQVPKPPAAGTPDAGGFVDAPAAPAPAGGETVEPEITIREAQDRTIYEYRVRGVLYMVKIQPQFGPPYYLIDTDGNGTLDQREGSPMNINIPQWVLFTWK